jgi:hypothetical protein
MELTRHSKHHKGTIATLHDCNIGTLLGNETCNDLLYEYCIQDMLYIRNILESMVLIIKLPIRVELNKKGAKDIINNWSVGGEYKIQS